MQSLPLTLLLLAPLLAAAQQPSPNLLLNSGFEIGRPGSGRLRSWTPSVHAGVTCERTEEVHYAGRACARLAVAPGTEVIWYQLYQKLTQVSLKQPYTLSAWVKTENVADGAGAYLSINFYARDGNRVNYLDSSTFLKGTTDWTRITVTARALPAATEMRAILLLHGRGVAWFDNVQLEAGTTATDYRPSRADADAAAAAEAARADADAYLQAVQFVRRPGQDVAILRDDFPRRGAPSNPEVLAATLRGAGFATYFLDGAQLANPGLLSPDRFDLVILPYGRAFPAVVAQATSSARVAFQDYLSSGGCFLSMGGYAFDDQMVKAPQGWVPAGDLPRTVGDRVVPVFGSGIPEVARWGTGAGPGGPAPVLTLDDTADAPRRALRFSATPMRHWATAVSPTIPPERFFEGWSELVFRARGEAGTQEMLIEWHERDGARWKALVNLTTDWREHVLLPTDFTFWPDGSPPGRGGPGDRPDLTRMASLLLGLSTEVAQDGGNYSFCVSDFRLANDPLAPLRLTPSVMNTRTCRIADAMWPEPEQIGVFDPSHPLRNSATARLAPFPGAPQPPAAELRGPFEGFAAVGVLSVQGHGFGPDQARLVPVVESADRYGRPRGALGSLMFQFAGYYQGSAWGFFGVENQDLFSDRYPDMLPRLPELARSLVDRFFLFGTEAQYNCYRPGEPVTLLTHVANYGLRPRRCRVELTVRERGGLPPGEAFARELTVEPKGVQDAEFAWTAPVKGGDLYEITSSLFDADGKLLDREMNGVVVWREEVVARGPRPVIKDTYFYRDGGPRYLLGCQNWWGTNGSLSQRRPLDFERDFRMMRDLGLRLSRCFLPWQTEEQKRASDAWVYLAQKHGIVMFHTPNLTGTADPKVLAEEIAAAKEIAARYRDVPGLIVDTCNETGVSVNDSDGQRAAFNAWLQKRYGGDAALKAAWAGDPPEKPLPEVPFRYPAQEWGSARPRDVAHFALGALARWSTETRDAFRSQRPDLAVTPGWGQGFGWGAMLFDPPLTSRDQDFTDQHYYGELAGFPTYLKTLDRRWDGRPWTVGECGARQHPSFPDGETEEEYSRRFLYLQHHAFGMGMAFTASWHWRDPMAGIFPFGKVHADFSLRDAALIERNQSLLFSRLHPRYEAAEVFLLLPDSHRLGGRNDLVVRAIQAAVDTLVGLHLHFESVCEADLPHLPPTCKTLVWPVPYCPSDATFDAVRRFLEGGGCLLVTGDVSYDEDRRFTRSDRVKQLTGATEVTQRYPGLELPATPTSEVTFTDLPAWGGRPRPPTYRGRPSLALTVPEASVVARDSRGAVATLRRLGRGQVLFFAEPIELENDVPRREIYAAFLKLAGAPRLSVAPDRGDLHVFRLPTLERGEIIVLHNAGEPTRATVQTPAGPLDIGLASMLPGMCVTDDSGRVTQAEAEGEVRLAGKRVMESTAHAAVIALDGKPLSGSQELLVLPFATGAVTVTRDRATPLRAECGEIRDGRWRALRADVPCKSADTGLSISCDETTRLEMVLLAPPASFPAASGRLAERVTQ